MLSPGRPFDPLTGPVPGGINTLMLANAPREGTASAGVMSKDNVVSSVWDTLTGQSRYNPKGFIADVGQWTEALKQLAAQYASSPLFAPLAMRAAGDRAAREAMGRTASARGANSALMMREAEFANEARNRQLAADAAAAAAQEGAARTATLADILTGAGNLDVSAQGITAGGNTAMQQLRAEQDRRNAENEQAFWAGVINTGAEVLSDTGSGAPNNDPYVDPTGRTATPGFPSDVRGKEDIQPMRDPVLEQALLADLTTQAAEETAVPRDALFEAAVGPRPPPPASRSRSSAGGGLLSLLGTAAGAVLGGPAGAAAGGATGAMLESSDRRGKVQIKPIKYSYSDERGKQDIAELLEMALDPEANRDNLEPVKPYTYRYKPEVAARIGEDTGRRAGIMAQDLERAAAGRAAVHETPEGKALDVNRALGFSLAGVAGLDKRVRELEANLRRATGGR